MMKKSLIALFTLAGICPIYADKEIVKAIPDTTLLQRPFDAQDATLFHSPKKMFFPETWFHYVNGNVDRAGITADLEAIAASGLAGVQFFHGGGFSDGWKGVTEPVYCLSDKWESLVQHTASEAQRLGLRFTMQNCPGWAMSGGPWIDFDHTMRHLTYSRYDIKEGHTGDIILPKAKEAGDPNRDYRDVIVLAFPTPLGDTEEPLFTGKYNFKPTTPDAPNIIDIRLDKPAVARTLEFSPIDKFNHDFGVDPGINLQVEAIDRNGRVHKVLETPMPYSNWQDSHTISLALAEQPDCQHYRILIHNRHNMNISSVRLLSAARKQNWEGEAGWTLRTVLPESASAKQSAEAYVKGNQIINLTDKMDADGKLSWKAPQGEWTILRIGHINTGRRNGPAPAEATGWECNKLDPSGAALHFKNYIGHMANGPVKGLVSNMLMDSWECYSQTWTKNMPQDFRRIASYPLEQWMPALFGFVIDSPETTARFLVDWRKTLNSLFVNNFFGEMSRLAHANGLTCTYETAGGDITPADPMEYYKFADVPMCEFWQPFTNFLYNRNYKPIRPTASAARMYGKPRVSAESFTSFVLTWDEHWQMLKDVANQNLLDGMSHFVFHTYTHNPGASKYFPGTSFGSGIGSPFLRGQTWWKHMPAFTSYLARCTYMMERGKPVSSVLWYIGDEYQQKPDQFYPFPVGYRYDYCNPDALLTRLNVKDGKWTTPDGITYPVLWIPQPGRMQPETLERLVELVKQGGILVADMPTGMATLGNGDRQAARYQAAVAALWPKNASKAHTLGNGRVLSQMSLENALEHLNIQPDVTGIGNQWLHRKAEGADWYFVCADRETPFSGEVEFNCTGRVEIWNPVSGTVKEIPCTQQDGKTRMDIVLSRAECAFVVFHHDGKPSQAKPHQEVTSTLLSEQTWTVSFPEGWGIDAPLTITSLKPWYEMVSSAEGKAFSGTATYRTTLHMDKVEKGANYTLQLGKVEMIAVVRLNGQELGTLWTEPYQANITKALKKGDNTLEIDVTSSWFNRLVYDAGLPEAERKTWVISGPRKEEKLRANGLLGPVMVRMEK